MMRSNHFGREPKPGLQSEAEVQPGPTCREYGDGVAREVNLDAAMEPPFHVMYGCPVIAVEFADPTAPS